MVRYKYLSNTNKIQNQQSETIDTSQIEDFVFPFLVSQVLFSRVPVNKQQQKQNKSELGRAISYWARAKCNLTRFASNILAIFRTRLT